MTQGEIAKPAHVVGIDEHAAAPVAAAGHRLHHVAVEHHPGVLVAEPAPGVGGADRVHDGFLEHLRQRTPPHIERREGQRVHAGVVVLVDGAGLMARPRGPLGGVRLRPVGPIGLAPKRAFPITGLAQHVIPSDGAIVRRVEREQQIGSAEPVGLVAGCWHRTVDLDRSDIVPHGVVDVADHPTVVGDTDDARQHALGHTVGHVDAQRLAPFGDDISMVNDQAGRVAAVLDGADGVAERFTAERLIVVDDEIARVLDLVRNGKVGGLLEPCRIEPGFHRRFMLPHRIRIVDRGSVVGPVRLRRGPRRSGNEQEHKGWQTNEHEPPPARPGSPGYRRNIVRKNDVGERADVVKFIGTHAEYDRVDPETVSWRKK